MIAVCNRPVFSCRRSVNHLWDLQLSGVTSPRSGIVPGRKRVTHEGPYARPGLLRLSEYPGRGLPRPELNGGACAPHVREPERGVSPRGPARPAPATAATVRDPPGASRPGPPTP